ncbi:phosphoribosylamine--glycine ligase [Thermosediminibacter oceani]|uniref:Phosphoribosylamine--glycine ligase n=1 Tax=Thermosediminibacter oceani (strain ATCC BAA-1034 / DSM 16646 / JW/IW-1228P) TaxID=555079 RepID=D9RY22_THEOJ|nr:phosphoribosylamine--glycine ligase [Thermosediminibacter oceani]ADL08246.1 phosphoribosylamine--glycine ligase [Thermosediminibacter oceani DSM 16646]
MKVLVVGGGGREHALVWKIAQSPRVKKIFCLPGNAGIAALAQCVDIKAEDVKGLAGFAQKQGIDLTVVGPEAPLVAGIVDEFEKRGLRIFGPSKAAARIEGSKVFAKELMKKYGIPTADYRVFDDPEEAGRYIREAETPLVIKAEGLAAGKGVMVAREREEALDAVKSIMKDGIFGDSGRRVVIEEFLEGREVTVLAFCDGVTAVPMECSRDYKRAYDKDRGPNTGGMGAVSPAHYYTPDVSEYVNKNIIQKTLEAMRLEGIPFKGVLYAGLMLTSKGPKVLEFNCRFGDPETQVVVPRLKTDLVDVIEAVIEGRLSECNINWTGEKAVCVVLASAGYPGDYEKGKEIAGIEDAEGEGAMVFHAGTALKDGKIITAGGRVLGVTALGRTEEEAREIAYRAVSRIRFDGMHYRKDIGL